MKKYKLWEVFKMLSENPRLTFRLITDRATEKEQLYASENGFILEDYKKDSIGFNNTLYIDDEWTLVQQPVSFMEAIKAFHNGETIYCIVDEGKYIYTPKEPEEYHITTITDEHGDGLSSKEILEGKWYIEDK